MSFILNALRKSEQERVAQQVETLEKKFQLPVSESNKKSTAIWFLILINLIFFVYFIWSNVKTDEAETYVKEKPDVQDVHKTEVVSVVKIISPAPRIGSIAKQIKKNQVQVKKIPSKIGQQLKPVEHNDIEEVQEPIKKAEVPARPFDTKDKSNEPAFLSELEYSFRRAVPGFAINVYVYSENKQDRFIMVDMKKYKPEQKMDNGITLKDIHMDSLVVEYKNRVFKIKRK